MRYQSRATISHKGLVMRISYIVQLRSVRASIPQKLINVDISIDTKIEHGVIIAAIYLGPLC